MNTCEFIMIQISDWMLGEQTIPQAEEFQVISVATSPLHVGCAQLRSFKEDSMGRKGKGKNKFTVANPTSAR